ncbi:MAG TPA: Gfo/Idh/MocA family oxidoreductase [Thermoanaerobaculia bacterium]|jgi:predicted dehydrogenase
MLRGAILGVGHVAVHGHLPGWKVRDDVSLVAAADARPERRNPFLAAFPEARWYARAEDLLANEALDFAVICTPPASHAALCRAALQRSLHVLCEKPLVLSPEELRGLPALAAEKERTLFTVHNWKHAPILAKATELVRSGAIGEIRRCRWETLRTGPAVAVGEQVNWRVDPSQSGGGVLVDHGWHALYLVQDWMASVPRSVAALLETRKHKEWPIEDTADLFLAYPSSSAEIFLTWAAEERANRLELTGANGRVSIEEGNLALFDAAGTEPSRTWIFPALTEGSHHPDWFGGVIDDFVAEIEDPRKRGRNLGEAVLCANVLALAKESSRRGGEPLPADRLAGGGRR